jgi:hypothetical protein
MPELTADCTPAPLTGPPHRFSIPDNTPPLPPDAILTPAPRAVPEPVSYDWEELPCFRETFLMYVTPKGYDAALRTFGEMLYSLLLEAPAEWPGWTESATKTEMRAAAADLRHLQGFLGTVGREREVSSLDAEDAYLSGTAKRLSSQLGRMAGWIERELAGVPR